MRPPHGSGSSIGGAGRRDPAWKYGTEISESSEKKSYVYLQCNFCNQVIKGGVKRMKDHLACTRLNVKPCPKVPEDVKKEISDYLNKATIDKHNAQARLDDMAENGSYFGDRSYETVDSPIVAAGPRGVKGPLDRLFMRVGDADEDGSGKASLTKPSASQQEFRARVCYDIGRFFYENGIAFNVARSPSFVNMCRSIGLFGTNFKPPSMHDLRTWILKEELQTTEKYVGEIKETWKETGVTIMSDGWTDIRNRSLINFLVNNPHGTVFLKSVDASDVIKDQNMLFKLLDDVVEEVGEDIVVQVVTDNAANYKAAGRLLMEKRKKLFWTPCAAHCVDLMLEKLGDLPQHKRALLRAKRVSKFIYNHSWVLALMRKFTKKEIVRPATTRFATAFLTLDSMYKLKQPLQSMFVSEKWGRCAWSKKLDGKQVKKIIMDERNFWPAVQYAINSTEPLVQVLRIVDSEKEPAMGLIYGAMDKAKERIAKKLGGVEANYKEIWDIIDSKWELQLHRHLHAAAYYLNPQFRYAQDVSNHFEIKMGFYHCLEKFVVDEEERAKIDTQLDDFLYKRGLFGVERAKQSVFTRPPYIWWNQFGDQCPELKSFAVRILSLTCSASGCERNWSAYNQVHTKRRNRLSTKKMNTLVYIMFNKKLKDRHLKKKGLLTEECSLFIDDLPSDDEWIANDLAEATYDLTLEDSNEGSSGPRREKQSRTNNRKDKGTVTINDDNDEEEWEEYVQSDEGDESDPATSDEEGDLAF